MTTTGNESDFPNRRLAKRASTHYLQHSTGTASQIDLLLMALDGAVKAAKSEDAEAIMRILDHLIECLQLEPAPEFAIGQLRIYHHCRHAAQRGEFQEIIHLLDTQRDAWEILKNNGNL